MLVGARQRQREAYTAPALSVDFVCLVQTVWTYARVSPSLLIPIGRRYQSFMSSYPATTGIIFPAHSNQHLNDQTLEVEYQSNNCVRVR